MLPFFKMSKIKKTADNTGIAIAFSLESKAPQRHKEYKAGYNIDFLPLSHFDKKIKADNEKIASRESFLPGSHAATMAAAGCAAKNTEDRKEILFLTPKESRKK